MNSNSSRENKFAGRIICSQKFNVPIFLSSFFPCLPAYLGNIIDVEGVRTENPLNSRIPILRSRTLERFSCVFNFHLLLVHVD